MSRGRKILKGAGVLAVGRALGYACSFARGIILARTLSKADYGLAAVFAMAMTLLELSGRMGFGQQVIQSKHGDQESFQASAHSFQLIAAIFSALLIAGMSLPMARMFGVPHTWWAFLLLTLVPLCQGLSHLDVCRFQREFNYLPTVLVDVVPQLIITLAAWPLAVWFGDYRVIVWLMIAKAVFSAVLSLILSKRPYSWAWERAHVGSMLRFGWPLILNSLVMFGCQQADQILVGMAFSLDAVADYSLAFNLVSIPWFIFSQVGASLMIPQLSQAQEDTQRLRHDYRICLNLAAVAGVILTVPLIVAGEQIVVLLFGLKYQGTGIFVALLGVGFNIRFLRLTPAIAALARGDTINQLYSNLWRAGSIPLALGAIALKFPPHAIAICAIAGELLATLVSVVRLRKRQSIPFRDTAAAVVFVLVFSGVGLAVGLLLGPAWSLSAAIAGASFSILLPLVVAWFVFSESLGQAMRVLEPKIVQAKTQPPSS